MYIAQLHIWDILSKWEAFTKPCVQLPPSTALKLLTYPLTVNANILQNCTYMYM